MTDAVVNQGQAAADSVGTTAQAPSGDSANSVAQAQTTQPGLGVSSEETFFDPASIAGKPELEAAYKQMQSAFTKRNQEFSKNKSRLELVTKFEQDPMGTIRQVAAQYGVQIVPQDQKQPEDWNPQSWEDVMARAKQEVLKEMNPVFNEVKALKKQNIEAQLDKDYPDWRSYEGDMMGLLKDHPSLVNDPGKLYRLSVPQEIIEQRATKAAMQKLQASREAAQVTGSTNAKQVSEPTGPLTFQQAADRAIKALAAKGLRRPA